MNDKQVDRIAAALEGIATSLAWIGFAILVLGSFTMCAATLHH